MRDRESLFDGFFERAAYMETSRGGSTQIAEIRASEMAGGAFSGVSGGDYGVFSGNGSGGYRTVTGNVLPDAAKSPACAVCHSLVFGGGGVIWGRWGLRLMIVQTAVNPQLADAAPAIDAAGGAAVHAQHGGRGVVDVRDLRLCVQGRIWMLPGLWMILFRWAFLYRRGCCRGAVFAVGASI